MQDIDFAIHYPFSSVAKEFLSSIEVNDRIIELAIQRIKSALLGEVKISALGNELQKLDEIASFAAARMMLSHMKNRYITARFAVAESKKANHHLSKENESSLDKVAAEFGIITTNPTSTSISISKDGLLVPVYTFVKFSPRSVDYKLSNRSLSAGFVSIKKSEKIRLIEEAVRKKIEKMPPLHDVPEIIKQSCERLVLELPQIEPQARNTTVSTKDFPPCIERMITSMKKHENLSHTQRWCLAVYLIGANMPMEEMIGMYSNLPDFNEKITSYQLEHAKKKSYTMPACATMLSYGLACADCKLGNPMNWGRCSPQQKDEIRKKNQL